MGIEIRRICHTCEGDGIVSSPNGASPSWEITCPTCGGSGHLYGEIDVEALQTHIDDIIDKCDDILDKCNDIFEKVNE